MGGWRKELQHANYQKNKEKFRERTRLYVLANPDKRKETIRKTQAKIDDIVYSAKDKPCMDCGIRFPLCAMQFDHVRGEKIADIAKLRSGKSKIKILAEINKCDVVCANCHAIRTCTRDSRPKTRRCTCIALTTQPKALPETPAIEAEIIKNENPLITS